MTFLFHCNIPKMEPPNTKGSLLGGPAATVGSSHCPCTPHGRANPRQAPRVSLTGKGAPAATTRRGQARVDSGSTKASVPSLLLLPTWVRGHFFSAVSYPPLLPPPAGTSVSLYRWINVWLFSAEEQGTQSQRAAVLNSSLAMFLVYWHK